VPPSDDLVLVFIPALAPLLLRAEQLKGSPLTEAEVLRIRDKATCVSMTREQARKIEEERGYADLDPEEAWAEWQQFRRRGEGSRAVTPYHADLALIHDDGFGAPALAASGALLAALRRAGVSSGRVVDLACGSGILSQRLSEAGFDVLGIDLSPDMLALARQRAPKAAFVEGSLLSADLPPCVAVAIVGEGVNFLFDESHSRRALARLFRRIHAALSPGGVLLFDAAGPERTTGRQFREGDGWAVLVDATTDRKRTTLTRRIVSFRRVGQTYRRDEEVHRLRLLPPDEVMGLLRGAGFGARVLSAYGEFRFPAGWAGFLARK
jgi:SAM-dependent methyltransferase